MRLFGSSLEIVKTGGNDFSLSALNYDNGVHAMYSGIDWIYTHVETLYMYDYKVLHFWLLNNVYDESMDFFFLSVWYSSLQISSLQLFWAVLLDNYIASSILQFSLTDEWVRSFISSKDSALFVIYHPEVIFFKNQILNNYFFEVLTDVNISAIQYLDSQSLLSPIMLFPQLLFIAYMAFFFVSFYFSYYSTSSKEESTVDSDYLSASITIESEKELGSLDDILMPSIVIIYTFGWYFYLYCWNLFSCAPELALGFFFFPVIILYYFKYTYIFIVRFWYFIHMLFKRCRAITKSSFWIVIRLCFCYFLLCKNFNPSCKIGFDVFCVCWYAWLCFIYGL